MLAEGGTDVCFHSLTGGDGRRIVATKEVEGRVAFTFLSGVEMLTRGCTRVDAKSILQQQIDLHSDHSANDMNTPTAD